MHELVHLINTTTLIGQKQIHKIVASAATNYPEPKWRNSGAERHFLIVCVCLFILKAQVVCDFRYVVCLLCLSIAIILFVFVFVSFSF